MSVLYAVIGGAIVACSIFMILSRNLVRTLLGFSLLATGVNLLLFVAGGVGPNQPPIIETGSTVLGEAADPVMQALILTAIVIGFALTIVFSTLVLRVWRRQSTIDAREIDAAEALGAPHLNDPADG